MVPLVLRVLLLENLCSLQATLSIVYVKQIKPFLVGLNIFFTMPDRRKTEEKKIRITMNIYFFCNGKWEPIAKVEDNTIVSVDEEKRFGPLSKFLLPNEVETLKAHERNVVRTFAASEKDSKNGPLLNQIVTEGERGAGSLVSYLLERVAYRRGTVIIMAQKSPAGVRVVAYASDKIHHFGTSYGTSPPDSVKLDELVAHIKKLKTGAKKPESSSLPEIIIKLIQAGRFKKFCESKENVD